MEHKEDFSKKEARHGTDELYRFLLWSCIVLALVRLPFGKTIFAKVLLILVLAVAAWAIFRVCSKNLPARRQENRMFLQMCHNIKKFFRLQVTRVQDRKHHVYRVCPECRAVLRLPKKTGEFDLECPRCHTEFTIHIK